MAEFENLDLACARVGREIASKPSQNLYKVVTDALSVLEQQGVYALFLYLKKGVSKASDRDLARHVSTKLEKLLQKTPQHTPLIGSGDSTDDILDRLAVLAGDLASLLLARDLLHQSLIYARYHARTAKE